MLLAQVGSESPQSTFPSPAGRRRDTPILRGARLCCLSDLYLMVGCLGGIGRMCFLDKRWGRYRPIVATATWADIDPNRPFAQREAVRKKCKGRRARPKTPRKPRLASEPRWGCTDRQLFETLLAFPIALALMFDPAFEFGQHVRDPLPNFTSQIVTQRCDSRATPNQDIGERAAPAARIQP